MFPWISNVLLFNYLGQKNNEIKLTVTTYCIHHPCLLFMYQNSKRNLISVSLNRDEFTLDLLRAKRNWMQTDGTNRLNPSSMSSLYVSKLNRNGINNSLNKQYLILHLLRAKSKRTPFDCNNRLHLLPMSSLKYQNSKRIGLCNSLNQ